MNLIRYSKRLLAVLLFFCATSISAQNSVLVNFGSNTCSAFDQPSFSLIKNPLNSNPILIANCNMQAQLPDFYSVFVAYNPKNNKVYIADIRSGLETKIWVLDIGLPGLISCPISIPVSPTYSYSYISNNFEFDNNGDLWSFSNYNFATGQCNLDKFDVNTGQVINTRILQFPAGNYPNTITSGDLCILPNGRMFATLGSTPSRLYEITNYSGTSQATANFLTLVPKDCYGIAYLNGKLEIAGNDFAQSCYYFDYDISTGVLGNETPFQVGNSPIDNTSFTPAIGNTKRLLNATQINSNTFDLTYEIYVENMGNVIMKNLELNDDLGATFGGGNVSNVQTRFASGFNGPGLALNPLYNGTTITSVLNSNQDLPNRILTNTNYFFKVQISCRVTNLQQGVTYLNSALCGGNIGSANNNSLVSVSDSSNNGDYTFVDPNNNGIANENGENIPTPFSIGLVPVKFISLHAEQIDKNQAAVKWQIATPASNAESFMVEYSLNGKSWSTLGSIKIIDNNQAAYQFMHTQIPAGNIFYRIKQTDKDGTFIYSRVVLLRDGAAIKNYLIYPNPAADIFSVTFSNPFSESVSLELFDITGRKLFAQSVTGSNFQILSSLLSNGTYLLKIKNQGNIFTEKIIIRHP